jgi:hypothetical protein
MSRVAQNISANYRDTVLGRYLDTALVLQKKALDLRRPHPKLLQDLRRWMNLENLGNIRIFSPDWRAWDNGAELENDLLTFENSRLDSFTSFLNFTVVDIYHNLVGRHIHVSTKIMYRLDSAQPVKVEVATGA